MQSPYARQKLFVILFPPLLIGAAEYIRHEWWVGIVSMERGNWLITLIVFVLSLCCGELLFRNIASLHDRLSQEEAKRAVYEERERLANELHDNIAQSLFFMNVKLQKGDVEGAKSAATEINNHVRQAIFNLKSPPLKEEHFLARLQDWLKEWSILSGIPCDIRFNLAKNSLTTSQEVKILGLIQEAFTNIRKHSRATDSSIRFIGDALEWELAIRDNGIGMVQEESNPSRLHLKNRKYGILMMAQRAQDVKASFSIAAPEQGGTEIRVVRQKGGEAK